MKPIKTLDLDQNLKNENEVNIYHIKTIFIIFFLIFFAQIGWSQKTPFAKYFIESKGLLLIDDITIKHSEGKTIDYDVIKEEIVDTLKKPLITIDNKKYHTFKAIGSCKVNDSISYYVFSHRSGTKKVEISNDGYLAIFNKGVFLSLVVIYSNYIEENNFGSILMGNKILMFKVTNFKCEYYKIDDNGFVYEDEQNIDIDNINVMRENKYKLELNANFFHDSKKVLLKIMKINNERPRQVLRIVADNHYKMISTFLLDINNFKEKREFIYLNKLQSLDNKELIAYEVVKVVYDMNNELLNYSSISNSYTNNNVQFANNFTLIPPASPSIR